MLVGVGVDGWVCGVSEVDVDVEGACGVGVWGGGLMVKVM